MNFKAPEISVCESTPFANDKLSRKDEVKNISRLLMNLSTPIVFSINAPWGEGKTTFLKMTHAYMAGKGCKGIYISAWETDYATDPLIAFLGEMDAEISKMTSGNPAKAKAWGVAKKAGLHIVRKGLPALIRMGTYGLVDLDGVIEGEVAKICGDISTDIIDEYYKTKQSIDHFKNNIKSIVNDDEKIFIFIDELDRCRPTYSIEFLERVKHLLNIDGLVFVLCMDKSQLAHSVRAIYGGNFEAEGYLKRFIDIEYSLKKPELDEYIEHLFSVFGFDVFFEKRMQYGSLQHDKGYIKRALISLSKYKCLALREIEQILSKIKLVILLTKEKEFLYPELMVFLVITKEYNKKLYEEFIQDKNDESGMIEYLYEIFPESIRYNLDACADIEGMIIASKYSDRSNEKLIKMLSRHKAITESQNINEDIKDYSHRVIQVASNPVESGKRINLNRLISRIELSEQFEFAQ